MHITSTTLLTACGILFSATHTVQADELKSTIVTIDEFAKLDHPFYYSIHYSSPSCNTSAVNFHFHDLLQELVSTSTILMLFLAVDICTTSQVVGIDGRELYVYSDVCMILIPHCC